MQVEQVFGPTRYGTLLLFGFVYSIVFARLFWNYRYERSVKWFIVGTAMTGIWLTLEGLFVLISGEMLSFVVLYLIRYAGVLASVSVFIFVIEYTRGLNLNYKQVSLFFLPLVFLHIFVLLTPNTLFSEITIYDSYADWSYSIYGSIHYMYLGLLHIVSIGNLVLEIISSSQVGRKQSSLILASYTVAVVPAFIFGFDFFPPYFNPTLASIAISLVVMSYGLKHYSIFTANAVSSSSITEEIREGILVTNSKDLITEYNETATQILGDIKIGDSIADIQNNRSIVKDLVDDTGKERIIEVSGRTYDATSYSISGRKTILIFRDNTELHEKTEKLDLIRKIHSRIFRHNLRNELTVIDGHSTLIEKNPSDTSNVIDSIETINSATQRLLVLNDKTSKINEVISSIEETKTHNISNVIDTEINTIKNRFDIDEADIQIDIQDEHVTAHKMLPLAIENILENAFEHNDDPTVWITSEQYTENRIKIQFTDDGCGIERAEHRPVTDGDVTQLQHASSNGLWLIKWIVQYASPLGEYKIKNTDNGTKNTIILKKEDTTE